MFSRLIIGGTVNDSCNNRKFKFYLKLKFHKIDKVVFQIISATVNYTQSVPKTSTCAVAEDIPTSFTAVHVYSPTCDCFKRAISNLLPFDEIFMPKMS